MFERRMGDDAEGDSRMIGSGRRDELDPGFFASGSPADGVGTTGMGRLPGFAPAAYAPVRDERLRPRKISAVLRTCEKSCHNQHLECRDERAGNYIPSA